MASSSPFRTDCLAGRVALITGGGSGIGFEIARAFGLHGGSVAIMGRRESFLAQAVEALKAENIKASYIVGDVRKEEDGRAAVDDTVRTHGSLDTLVNSAAGNFLATAEGLKPKGFRTVLEIDSVGVFNMCNAAFEALKASGRGVIINISATLHYGASWYQVSDSMRRCKRRAMRRRLTLHSWRRFMLPQPRQRSIASRVRWRSSGARTVFAASASRRDPSPTRPA